MSATPWSRPPVRRPVTPTPSLKARVVRSGLGVVALLELAVLVAVFLGVQIQLERSLDDVLQVRAGLVAQIATTTAGEELADALQAAGIPATVRSSGGSHRSIPETGGPLQPIPNPVVGQLQPPIRELSVDTPAGEVVVLASAAGVGRTLRGLLVIEAVGFALSLLVARSLLRRSTEIAMAPLTAVVLAANRTASGDRGQRLSPTDPDTELGRLARSFDMMVAALEEALDDARASDERSQRFLQDAAHQLRTPIATIRASVELILRVEDPEQREQLLVGIVRETGRSGRLLSSLLRVARLDRGEPPARTITDIVGLCRDEVERGASLSPQLSLVCTVRDEVAPMAVQAADLREALSNLIDNARRHAHARVEVTLGLVADQVEIWVRDDGPGIPADQVDLVFDRFYTDSPGGAGLGLPIARAVTQSHGGSLDYTDNGFVMRLPLQG